MAFFDALERALIKIMSEGVATLTLIRSGALGATPHAWTCMQGHVRTTGVTWRVGMRLCDQCASMFRLQHWCR